MQHTQDTNRPTKAKRLTAMSRLKLTHAAEMIFYGVSAENVGLIWRVSLPQVHLWLEEIRLTEKIQDTEYTRMWARVAERARYRGR